MIEYQVKDSGEREQFNTGAVRDTREGKGRFDLIPSEPMFRLARHYELGAAKYTDHNWKKGIKSSRCLDSLLRHAFAYSRGDREEDHLSAVVFNAFAIMWNEDCLPEIHDLHSPKKDDNADPRCHYCDCILDGDRVFISANENTYCEWGCYYSEEQTKNV